MAALVLILVASSSCIRSAISHREERNVSPPIGQNRLSRLADLADSELRTRDKWRQSLAVTEWELIYFSRYALKCLAGYHDVAYHNMYHALNVFDFVLDVFRDSPKLNRTQLVGIALAALCHDYGHPGLNNAFMALHRGDRNDALSADEVSWMNPYFEAVPQGGGWSAVGRKVGQDGMTSESSTYISYPSNYDYVKSPILEDLDGRIQVFAKGCGEDCSSIQESYHAAKAVEIARTSELGQYGDIIHDAILATDMGKDYWLRERLLREQRAGNLQNLDTGFLIGLAIHLADIGGSASKEFILWTVGIVTEFDRQVAVGGKGMKLPETFGEFFQSQLSWMSGVGTLFNYGFEALGVSKSSYAVAYMNLLRQNKEYFEACLKSSGRTKMPAKNEDETTVALRDRIIHEIVRVCLVDAVQSPTKEAVIRSQLRQALRARAFT